MNGGELLVGLLAQACLAMVPFLLAGTGELLGQRAGIINVGIEGLMLSGSITAFTVASLTGSGWLGLLIAMLAAGLLAAAFAVATVYAKVDQIVAGMAINLISVGVSGTIWAMLQASGHQTLPVGAGFDPMVFLAPIPGIGPLLARQYALLPIAFGLVCAAWLLLTRTRCGVILTALGEDPDTAAAAGVQVRRARLMVVVLAGMLSGLAGAYLSTMRTHSFVAEMTGGAGFLVLALVIFGRWRPIGLLGGCFLVAMAEASQQFLQSAGWGDRIPVQLFTALPYLVALLALCLVARGSAGPRALNQPWPADR